MSLALYRKYHPSTFSEVVGQEQVTEPLIGPGSLDVIELDAATHGLVDDSRDLPDKAFFAPVNSKYNIHYILLKSV